MAELVLGRIAAPMRGEWFGARQVLLLQIPRKPWFPRLPGYERALERNTDAHLFADSSTGHRARVPAVEKMR